MAQWVKTLVQSDCNKVFLINILVIHVKQNNNDK